MTIETEENIVLRASGNQRTTLMWCPACRRQVEMVTPDQAARIAGVSTRTIYCWVEAGKLHFAEEYGDLLICRPALNFGAEGEGAIRLLDGTSENRK